MVVKSKLIKDSGTLKTTMIVAKIVDKDIPYHVNLTQFSPFFISNVIVTNSSCEENITQTINNKAVNLLRHTNVKASRSSRYMS